MKFQDGVAVHGSTCNWKLQTVSQLEKPLISQTPPLQQDTLSKHMEIEARAIPEKLVGSRPASYFQRLSRIRFRLSWSWLS